MAKAEMIIPLIRLNNVKMRDLQTVVHRVTVLKSVTIARLMLLTKSAASPSVRQTHRRIVPETLSVMTAAAMLVKNAVMTPVPPAVRQIPAL